MRIRVATIGDAVEISRLHKSTIRTINSRDYSPEDIEVWSKRTNTRRMRSSHPFAVRAVAVEKGKIVGFADLSKDDPGRLWGLYVHKNHQGKGIGSRLLARMEKEAKILGAKKMMAQSTVTAKTFYERHGFIVLRKEKYAILDRKLTVYMMEKDLV